MRCPAVATAVAPSDSGLSSEAFTDWFVSLNDSTGVVEVGTVSSDGTRSSLINYTDTSPIAAHWVGVGTSHGIEGSFRTICLSWPDMPVCPFALMGDGSIVVTTASLDYESQSHYGLAVRATDGYGAYDCAYVRVDILNLPEPPFFTSVCETDEDYVACLSIAEKVLYLTRID
jgi:hypothetical protein